MTKTFHLLLIGCMFGFGMFLVLFYTFLNAYFYSSKTTLFAINIFGEANIELFMFSLLLDFFIISLFYGFKQANNEKKQRKRQVK